MLIRTGVTMPASDTARLTVTFSREADLAMRAYSGAQGMRKGDLSRFIEDAVRWRMFDSAVQAVKVRNADIPPEDLYTAWSAPCIFRIGLFEGWLVEAVGKWAESSAVGNAQRCPRQARRFERSSNCPLIHSPAPHSFGVRCAKPVGPQSFELVGERWVNAAARSFPTV
jgi:hypothetical protein